MMTYGLSKTSVIQLLEANGVELRRQPPTSEQIAEAVRITVMSFVRSVRWSPSSDFRANGSSQSDRGGRADAEPRWVESSRTYTPTMTSVSMRSSRRSPIAIELVLCGTDGVDITIEMGA